MTDCELHDAAVWFVATAAQMHPKARWPMDHRAFAKVVVEQQEKGNSFAQLFEVYPGVIGDTCLDFENMWRSALFSTLISYVVPNYTQCVLNVSGRFATKMLAELPEDKKQEVLDVVSAYWEQSGACE